MTPLAPIRLLIVDDETAQMQALCDTLQDHGYQAVGCSNGEAALAKLHEQPFDVLLADLMMPGMDGIALLRAALLLDPMLVAVIMTGAGTIGSAVDAMQSGALDYILKPFKLSAIVPVLSRAMAVRRLRQDNAALEERVRERSAELEAANAELDAFARSVSHDLRNPLQAIIGFAGLLNEEYAGDWAAEARDWLNQIRTAATDMDRLTADLLRLARLGRQALRLERVDMAALVHSVASEQARLQPDGRATLRIGVLPALVLADASLLRQALTNLLSNAYKFSRDQPLPLVEIGSEQQGAESVFFVRDNGVGFDMGQAQRLFVAFERLHGSDEFEGTGVGLSTVQRIVQRHGGRIWAQAAPGRGATFYFTLGREPA